MSIQVMNLVWIGAPYRGNTLLTLLALADWSNDDGYSFPSLEKLARKSRQSIRSVQYAIEQLQADGILIAELNQGRGTQNSFYINTQKLHVLADVKTCKTEQENTQSATVKHAKRDNAIRKNRYEPSKNHQGPPNPPAGGLTPRQLKQLSSEMNQMAGALVGVRISERDLLQRACQKLLIPFDDAYKALLQTLPPEERGPGVVA
jgi:biotin operon repressor